jgi:myosin heavy subunit
VFKILAVILNIGNLMFRKDLTKNNEEIAVVVNKEYLRFVAELLAID